MKPLLLFVTVVLCVSCKAQIVEYTLGNTPELMPSEDFYVKDNNNYYGPLIGSWISERDNSIFEITLEKFEYFSYYDTTRYSDEIYGKYNYSENGNVITEIMFIQPFPYMPLVFNYRSPTTFSVLIKDIISDTHKTGEFILTSPTTATMRLWDTEGIKVNYGNGQPWALPTYFEFIKQ